MLESNTSGGMAERPSQSQEPPYSIFSKTQKRYIVVIVALAGLFSPLSSFIYYPATKALADSLHTSIEAINLSITSYMIVSGVFPSILGDAADQIGRRPVYIFAFVVYIAANAGLALQDSYSALLILRMVQSVGSSGTIALAYGVIADIAPPSERGSYVGAVLCGPNVAPSLGPVLGAALADRIGWRWIFWFLCIMSGLCLLIIVSFLPETARQVVGNGSTPARGINQSLLSKLMTKSPGIDCQQGATPSKLRLFNPLNCLSVILFKDIASVLLVNAIFYMIYCCAEASLSSSFIAIYHYSELDSGLIYLPFGLGCALASYASGHMMNRDYAIVARENNYTIDRIKGDNLAEFPIEKARLRSVWYLLVVVVLAIAGYGWSIFARAHVAIPLVMQFSIGVTTTMIFNICGTLAVDLNSQRPSTISAGSNFMRCTLAAGGLAVLQSVINGIGIGWCFTIFAAIAAMSAPLLLMEIRWGPVWRSQRAQKSDEAARAERAGVQGEEMIGGQTLAGD